MGQSTRTVSTHYLESTDSGVHTCTVYGFNGEMGSANMTVYVVGKFVRPHAAGAELQDEYIPRGIQQPCGRLTTAM